MGRFREFLNVSEHRVLAENWRQYDNDIAYLYQQEIPLSSIKTEIEASFGSSISLAEIYRALRRTGVNPNRRQRPYHDDVIYFGQSGMRLEEISELTGYSVRHVRNILNANQLQD